MALTKPSTEAWDKLKISLFLAYVAAPRECLIGNAPHTRFLGFPKILTVSLPSPCIKTCLELPVVPESSLRALAEPVSAHHVFPPPALPLTSSLFGHR